MSKVKTKQSGSNTTAVHVVASCIGEIYGTTHIHAVKFVSLTKAKVTLRFAAEEKPADARAEIQAAVIARLSSAESVEVTSIEAATEGDSSEVWPLNVRGPNAPAKDDMCTVTIGSYSALSAGTHITGNLDQLFGIRIMKVKVNTKTNLIDIDFHVGEKALAELKANGQLTTGTASSHSGQATVAASHGRPSAVEACAADIIRSIRESLKSDSKIDEETLSRYIERSLGEFQNECYTKGFVAGKSSILLK
eukprot:223242_1